jgi:septal ring factor EnvC (AmiA/AmiB activator)
MIKKALLVVGGLGVLSVFIFGRDAVSYATTSYGQATEAVTGSFPTEFQIDRARRMVRELQPEIQECARVIARQQVEVDQLDERITRMDGKLDKDKADIVRLQGDLAEDRSYYTYASNRRYSADEVRDDLNRRFERYKTSDATIAHLRKMRDARQKQVDAAKSKLEEMVAAERQLAVEVENLEAQLKLVQVAEATSNFNFDDSKLARAKELVGSIRTDLEVASRLAATDVEYSGEIPLDSEAPSDIEEQVANYFGLSGREIELASTPLDRE